MTPNSKHKTLSRQTFCSWRRCRNPGWSPGCWANAGFRYGKEISICLPSAISALINSLKVTWWGTSGSSPDLKILTSSRSSPKESTNRTPTLLHCFFLSVAEGSECDRWRMMGLGVGSQERLRWNCCFGNETLGLGGRIGTGFFCTLGLSARSISVRLIVTHDLLCSDCAGGILSSPINHPLSMCGESRGSVHL